MSCRILEDNTVIGYLPPPPQPPAERWGRWKRNEFGMYSRRGMGLEVRVFPPSQESLWCRHWHVLRDGSIIAHGQAADRQDAARDAMAAARAIAAEATP